MITHDYKLFFIHIPKCAGRSISEVFNQRFDHYTADYYRREYAYFWKQYTAFAIVRNPYDRLVSMYHYIRDHRRHKNDPIACNNVEFKEWLITNIYSFKREFCYNSPEAERGTDWMKGSPYWFSSQVSFLEDINRTFCDVKVFKYESGMDHVREWLRDYTGMEIEKLPHLNKTEHGNYESYYDEGLLRVVNEFKPLLRDCAEFNYDLLKVNYDSEVLCSIL